MPKLRGVSSEGGDFLDRYAGEVALLAQGLGRLQHSLSGVYGRALDAAAVEDMQRLDAFTQTAEVLAQIAAQLARAPTLDRGAVAMMISNVNLADVAARLIGDTDATMAAGSGDMEMF